jgi:endo-1,4-beta-xylanase
MTVRMPRSTNLIAFTVVLSVSLCLGAPGADSTGTASGNDSLGRIAAACGRIFGSLYDDCCIPQRDLPVQEAAIGRFCTMITDAHFFMTPCHPKRDRFDFEVPDRVAAWGSAHHMLMRGHTLVWYPYVPKWLSDRSLTPAVRSALLEKHIKTVVGRYRGRMYAWDVVNEPFEGDGSYRSSFFYKNIGRDYIEKSLRWAHEADSGALLFINDYNTEELNKKSDALYALAKDLKRRGVPLDGIGFQMHLSLEKPIDWASVAENLRRFAALGLTIHFTEVDVKIRQPAQAADREAQAAVYRDLVKAFLAEKSCTALVVWALSDTTSWIPGYFKGYGGACILDTKYRPKPAFWAIKQEFNGCR